MTLLLLVDIYYIGPGKKYTGDWCFIDGFITFKDITDAYMECFRSKRLSIVSDCSYSGRWVSECREFLDKLKVQPCGHSAREKNILLNFAASCMSYEIPHTLLYSARGLGNDKNSGSIYTKGYCEVSEDQHTSYVIDSSKVVCKSGLDDPCALKEDYTWNMQRYGQRIHLVIISNMAIWYYLLIVDDDETLCRFQQEAQTGSFNHEDYGTIIKMGQGQHPTEEVQEEMERLRTGIEA